MFLSIYDLEFDILKRERIISGAQSRVNRLLLLFEFIFSLLLFLSLYMDDCIEKKQTD